MDITEITSILMIIGIDIVLGGDNAIVIALASKNLPKKEREKAIYLGTGLAVIIRILLTILAAALLALPFIQGIGGILLLYIAYKLLKDSNEQQQDISSGNSVFTAVQTIVFADLIMGIDNILAVAGASHGNIITMVFGLLVSIPIIVWGSQLILQLMEKFPSLLYIGASIIAFTSGEMITREITFRPFFTLYPSLIALVPFLTIIAIFVLFVATDAINTKNN